MELPAIRPAILARVVQRITQVVVAGVSEWDIMPLSGGFSGAQVYRVTGAVHGNAGKVLWAVVLKVLHADPSHEEPVSWAYWRREALLYGAGFLVDLPGDLRAPRCFLVEEEVSGSICLWLEALDQPEATAWSSAVYATAARTLGRFNGVFLAGRPIPSAPWLTRSWLRVHVEARATMVATLAAQRNHALVRLVWPEPNIAGVLRLWEERQVLLAALERLPQTFVHRDATPRNLMVHPSNKGPVVTAIDWGLAGPGVIGEDAGSLLIGQLTLGSGRATTAGELDRTIFDAYLDGLSLAGWQGEAQFARLGYTASVALRACLGFVANNVPALVQMTQEQLEASCWVEHGCSLEEMAEITATRIAVALDLADEARQITHQLQ